MAHDKRTRDLATMCIRFVAPYIWVAVSKAELPRPEKIQKWQLISTCLDFAKTNNSDRSLKIQKWQFISTCLDFSETNNSARSLSVKTLITVISLYLKTTPSWCDLKGYLLLNEYNHGFQSLHFGTNYLEAYVFSTVISTV